MEYYLHKLDNPELQDPELEKNLGLYLVQSRPFLGEVEARAK